VVRLQHRISSQSCNKSGCLSMPLNNFAKDFLSEARMAWLGCALHGCQDN
jgi:hypothetical protein